MLLLCKVLMFSCSSIPWTLLTNRVRLLRLRRVGIRHIVVSVRRSLWKVMMIGQKLIGAGRSRTMGYAIALEILCFLVARIQCIWQQFFLMRLMSLTSIISIKFLMSCMSLLFSVLWTLCFLWILSSMFWSLPGGCVACRPWLWGSSARWPAASTCYH